MKNTNLNSSVLKIKYKFNNLKNINYFIIFSLFLAWFFGVISLYFKFINNNDISGYKTIYYETNTYFINPNSSQIVFLFNPFAITSTIFISIAVLLSIFEWFNNFVMSLYLIKLFGFRVIFDNPLLNQILIYFLICYIVIWNTICPNPYFLESHFNFYVGNIYNSQITPGGIIFGLFYSISTFYIIFLIFNQSNNENKKTIIDSLYTKKILIFGITGSIGLQALKVINEDLKDKLIIIGATFNKNSSKMQEILDTNNIQYVYSPTDKFLSNTKSYEDIIINSDPDIIFNALSGTEGILISFLAYKYKKTLLLANKESLVCAGSLLIPAFKEDNIKIIPIDSEHTSLQALISVYKQKNIKNLLITCSGGPFFEYNKEQLANVSYKDALNHPTWKMGNKISIDSATLMNKTFEIIEAYWLFGTKNIFPILHKQSIVHSMITLKNDATVMYASSVSMLLPIQLGLNNFNYTTSIVQPLHFKNLNMTFDQIDKEKWTSLKLADLYMNKYMDTTFGILITILDEIAISKFKNNELRFNEIIPFIEENYKKFKIEKLKNFVQIKKLINEVKETYNYKND